MSDRPADELNRAAARCGTLPQVARIYGLSVATLGKAIDAGEIPCIRLTEGGWRRCMFDDVERWLRSHTVKPTRSARARVEEVIERERRAATARGARR